MVTPFASSCPPSASDENLSGDKSNAELYKEETGKFLNYWTGWSGLIFDALQHMPQMRS